MTLRASNQVLCNVWSYDFYDMTLATEYQRRHMIKENKTYFERQETKLLQGDVNRV